MSEQRCPECDEPLVALRHKPEKPICPNPDCGWPAGAKCYAFGHDFADGICKLCGERDAEQQPEYDAGWGWVLGGQA